uniref:Uncharacterized protein n=1 Tax=Myoviridae sp. ctPuP5 TaxID=2823543 RepID=A0A8S5L9N0_9CAUD|nr:MAG TPA: hypothetical protein [Myoviridae sp. ctPuP5]
MLELLFYSLNYKFILYTYTFYLVLSLIRCIAFLF